jgi:hypothetical protein
VTQPRILFRFHKDPAVCIQNLQILRRLNPGLAIDGLYGGENVRENLPEELTQLFDTFWAIPIEDPYYKWKNGDLCARWWYKEAGFRLSFSHLYFIEWDMLFVRPLAQAYGPLKEDCNYASVFGSCDDARKSHWYWIREQFGVEVGETLDLLKQQGHAVDFDSLDFAIMGGAVFCRKFLDLYTAQPVPSHSNDEARFSLWSAALGIPLLDNSLMRDSRNRFNAENKNYYESDVNAVIASGGSLVHPLRIVIDGLEEKIR